MEVKTKNALRVTLFQVGMPTTGEGTCSACDSVQGVLLSAIQEVQELFDHLNCEILFSSTMIKTIEEAEKAHIVASPTIRVGNLDFHPEHLEDSPEAREWVWNGATMGEPNKEILIEVLLKGYFEPKNDHGEITLYPYILKHLKGEVTADSNCGCH
ncbi:DUF2703 domain-containing protein [Flagellimonas amoyensis]|uniref:DUF2703 domain-containing protein n=1 Tax=Flagellimonas amoyensis TaxID=2169401 RepID=UPI00131F0FC0|nr:DUF2703 domain-containing protein [Allomuricauda amoyensis]